MIKYGYAQIPEGFVGTVPNVGLGLVVPYLDYSIHSSSRVDYSHRSPITVGDREEEMLHGTRL